MTQKITLKTIYDIVYRLEEKVDKKLEKMDERVNSLETFRDKALGLAVVIGLGFGMLVDWVKKRFLDL